MRKKQCLCTAWGVDGENHEYNGCPLHSENDRLKKEIADYGFFGAMDRVEAPLKAEIARLRAALEKAADYIANGNHTAQAMSVIKEALEER